ncbi:hypothetical protein Q9L58_003242 [Maublancomyces gigas]|uniref:Nicotianamine synthase n=1 Tax=Discina gigas TaxID=1032678 RepID=A0ABR3GP42_9PEZI
MIATRKPLLPKSSPGPFVIQGPPKDDTAEKYILTIVDLYEKLSKLPKLDPSPEVNSIFGKLVSVCAETPSEAIAEKVITDLRIVKITPHLRQLCSDGECRLEAYWAEKIGHFKLESQVNKALLEFPYYSNYVDLTKMELYALFSMSPVKPRSFAFIGSGPLPLTSLCIADIINKEASSSGAPIRIHNIDRDQQAISLSSSLCQKLGRRARSLTFQCTEAVEERSRQDLKAFDVVYLAALVGSTKAQKQEIISDVAGRMRPGAFLVLRSAHSLRSLLYPIIDAATDLRNSNLEPLLAVHPYNHIVNSVIIARVTAA